MKECQPKDGNMLTTLMKDFERNCIKFTQSTYKNPMKRKEGERTFVLVTVILFVTLRKS